MIVGVPGVFVAGADGIQEQALEGRVAVRHGALLRLQELDEVLGTNVAPELSGLEEEPLADGPGLADIVRFLHLDDLHVLQEQFVKGVEEVVGNIEAKAQGAEPRKFRQFRRVDLARFRNGDQDVLVFVDDLLVLGQLVHPVDLHALLLVRRYFMEIGQGAQDLHVMGRELLVLGVDLVERCEIFLVVQVDEPEQEHKGLGVLQGVIDLAAETGVIPGAHGLAPLHLLAESSGGSPAGSP